VGWTSSFLRFPTQGGNIADWLSSRTWALEVAQGIGMPGIRFNVHGFDISDDQFPSDNILPGNCRLSLGDAVVPPPEALRGTFDIVHVSQFACVRPLHEDPGATIEHAMALLSEFPRDPWHNAARLVMVRPTDVAGHRAWGLDPMGRVVPKQGEQGRHGEARTQSTLRLGTRCGKQGVSQVSLCLSGFSLSDY